MSQPNQGLPHCPHCGRAVALGQACGRCSLTGQQHAPRHPHLLCSTELLRDTFGPLHAEHRLEQVATIDGVCWINDSKSTNANSTWYALETVPGPIIWLAGGYKGSWSRRLMEPFRDLVRSKVKAMYDFGPVGEKLFPEFTLSTIALPCSDLYEAVVAARILAEPGDTVLLSPMCASFDAFANYEERGQRFKQYVLNP